MSSSNRVRVAYKKETVYGETPAGAFDTMRFTSESLSGTPETTESAQIRSDRLSSGQIVTGLTVGGDSSFELAKESQLEDFMESAMYEEWTSSAPVAVDMTIDTVGGTITRASGDWNVDSRVGDVLILSAFANSLNNTKVMVASIDSALVIKYVAKELADEVGVATSFQVADYLEIGVTKKSFSIEKAFEDLTDKAIIYKGMIVSNMSLNIAYGEIVNGSFSFQGNFYNAVDAAGDFITFGETINGAATTNSFNGSVDSLFTANSAGQANMVKDAFCIQSLSVDLNNNLRPVQCIGLQAPKDYNEGTAQVGINLTAYNEDDSWNLLDQKLSQTPFEYGAVFENGDGFYGFYLPAIQVSGDDPASGGQNQDVFQELSGTAKVGANGEKSLRIYRG